MSTKEEIMRSTSPTKCPSASLLVPAPANNNDAVTYDSKPKYVTNNNVVFTSGKHRFPKKQAVDVTFENITYNTWSWSMTRFQKGKCNHFLLPLGRILRDVVQPVSLDPSETAICAMDPVPPKIDFIVQQSCALETLFQKSRES
jgi:hypothetical protein